MEKIDRNKENTVFELRNKISQILDISVSSIKDGEPFWELFPPNSSYTQSKETTYFCEYVCNQYEVFLTEKEWESTTIIELADYIDRYSGNPEKMIRRIEKARKEMRSSIPWVSLFLILIVGLSYFVSEGSFERKLIVASTIGLMLSLCIWTVFYFENKKFLRETRWHRELN